MRSIKSTFIVLFSLMIIFTVAMTLTALFSTHALNEDRAGHSELTVFYKLSHELKQSSDHLTKFARAYVSTGDEKWKRLYYRVLDLRAGKFTLPERALYDYWDQASKQNSLFSATPTPNSGQSLIERISQSSLKQDEISQLARALNLSESLVELEVEAFNVIEHIKATQVSFSAENAGQELLYSEQYFDEKAKIMSAIAAAHNQIIERINTQIESVESGARRLELLELSMAGLLLITIVTSFTKLLSQFINPMSSTLRKVVSHVEKDDFAFTLDSSKGGEIGHFANSLNSVFQRISMQLSRNNVLKDFNIVLRNAQSTEHVCNEVTRFLAERLDVAQTGIYVKDGDKLIRMSGIGYGDAAPDTFLSPTSTQVSILNGGQYHSIRNLKGSYVVPVNGGRLSLEEVHYFPLHVNDKPVALLEIATTQPLTDNKHALLLEILEDLSVSIQLTQNAEIQRRAEQRALEQSLLNKEILDATPNPMFCLDTDGRFLNINMKFAELLGMFEVDILGSTPYEIMPADTAKALMDSGVALMENPGSHDFEVQLSQQDGTVRDMLVYEATFHAADGYVGGIVGILLDLTERKKMENALRDAKNAADDMSRTKDEFLANMSHEIRTPMNAIIGMAHLTLGTELSTEQNRYVSRINDSAKNLLGIINDILDFSKIEAGKLDVEHIPFQLEEVMDNLATVISFKAQEKSLEFLFDIDPTIPTGLVGDPLRMGQVLINLCGNAVKFTDRGEIVVSIKLKERYQDSVTLECLVRDTGIGIPEEQQRKLFEAFSQADGSITRKFGGTGLGLSITRRLVELMGGDISVQSEEGKGSTFSFTLECGLQEARIRQQYRPIANLRGKRVLVVDDNDSARDIMVTLLSAMHFDTQAVSSGEEALAELSNSTYDMIFLDWNMPGINGVDTMRKIRSLGMSPPPKLFLVTAHGREVGIKSGVNQLADALIIKPVNPSNLIDAIMDSYRLSPAKQHPSSLKEHRPDFSGNTVLVVEDNETNQEVAKGILSSVGLDVVLACDGQEALNKLDHQYFDLVFMDMQMPVMDGITATQKIREQSKFADLKIIAMTANAMKQDVDRCIEAGMDDHIAKPLDVNLLYSKISHYLNMPKAFRPESEISMPQLSDDNDMTWPDVEGIDAQTGIMRVGGNAETYWNLLDNFVSSQLREAQTLQHAIETEDWKEALHRVHTLRGSAGNLGATHLENLAEIMESSIEEAEAPDSAVIVDLINRLELLDQQIDTWKRSVYHVEEEPKVQLDAETLYHALTDSLKNYDIGAMEIFHQIKPLTAWERASSDKLEEAIDHFDYEIASEILKALPVPRSNRQD